MPPKKKRGTKRKRAASPTPSEQAILDALPVAGDLVTRTEQKSPLDVLPAYLVYVICRTDPEKVANVVIRKTYESKTEGVEAFKREYMTWAGTSDQSAYPSSHTEEQLNRAHLINLIDAKKAETSVVPDPVLENTVYVGRGRVEYEIIHRDDKEMDEEDYRQRKVVIVCEETRFEGL